MMNFKDMNQLAEDTLVLIYKHPKVTGINWNSYRISYISQYSDTEGIKFKAAVEAAIRTLSSYPSNFSYAALNQRIAQAEAVKKRYVHLNWLVEAVTGMVFSNEKNIGKMETMLLNAEK